MEYPIFKPTEIYHLEHNEHGNIDALVFEDFNKRLVFVTRFGDFVIQDLKDGSYLMLEKVSPLYDKNVRILPLIGWKKGIGTVGRSVIES